MKKKLALLVLLCAAINAVSENILHNSRLECGTSPMPNGWFFGGYIHGTCLPDGGPDNSPFVIFSAPAEMPVELGSIRQKMLTLVPGEKYRLSCYVRTKDFQAKRADFLIIDDGWSHSFALNGFPENCDWKLFAKEFTLEGHNSREDKADDILKQPFAALLYLENYSGEISFAQPSLEALTEKGRQGSSNGNMMLKQFIKAVPAVPRLDAIPAGTATLPVNWHTSAVATAAVTIDGKPAPAPNFDKGFFQIDISQLQAGQHALTISVTEDGQEVASNAFDFTILAPEPPCAERRLNPLTTELLAQPLQKTTSVTFTVPRRTWVYFKLDSTTKPTMTLSGDVNPLLTADSPRPEAQRRLNPGQYTVAFDTPVDGKLFIRTVPILYKYAGIDVTWIPGLAGCDLAFHQKHAFGVFNTIGARGVKEELRPYTASLGLECVDSFCPPSRQPFDQAHIDKFVRQMNSPTGLFAKKSNQWVEFDEYFFSLTNGLLNCALGFEKLENPLGKDLFHWFGGDSPHEPGLHHRILSTFMNAGGGHGYIAFEEYLKTLKTEKEAYINISNTLSGTANRMNDFIPGSNPVFGFIFGNFHQVPILSIAWLPEVNFKYFLDMEFHYLANHPEFTGLGLAGYWGFNYTNEEIARWCCELVRHYVLEGRTDSLAKAYGYTYLLPHLQNNDFENGLEGWRCTGDVKVDHNDLFGARNERRWYCSKYGQHFAVLAGNPDQPATISQTAVELVPGKPYTLEFITADYDDTMADKVNPRYFDIGVTLKDAQIVREFTYIDERTKGQADFITAKTNYRYYRFIPEKDTVELTFTGSAKAGEKLIMNYVKIAPYFEEQ